MNSELSYSVLVLFGREANNSIRSPAVFQAVLDSVAGVLEPTGCKLSCRGTVEGEKGRNLAPPKGVWSERLRANWLAAVGKDRFNAIEIYDSEWNEERHPGVFAAIHKMWGFGPSGYTERTKEGAENNITVAIRDDLLEGAFDILKNTARSLVDKIDCIYGSIELSVPWDRPRRSMREDMIDIRWKNRTAVDYRRGKYKMDELVPRLYCGNILCPTQLVNPDAEALAKLDEVSRVEEWPMGLKYLQLFAQPEYGAKPSSSFAGLVRFIPE